MGIPEPKENARNLVLFGCYPPFTIPTQLRHYIEILDRLGIEYTYLESEFCCSSPMISTTAGREREKAREAGSEFTKMNVEMAQQKGAKTISCFCVGCAHVVKSLLPDEAERFLYNPDLIIDKLEKHRLKVPPTAIGYYEGCRRRFRVTAPGIELN